MEVESTETEVKERESVRSFKINDFDGPLSLLLSLIRKNQMSIRDIQIAVITEQYLDYLRNAEILDLDDASEFHVMAATLLLIKSRELLPLQEGIDTEVDEIRQDLVERLIEYQKFKILSELMEDKEKEAEWILDRMNFQRSLPFDEEDLWEKIDVWSLMKTFSLLLRKRGSDKLDEKIFDLHEEVTTNEKIALLIELLESKGECYLSDLIIHSNSVMDIVCSFLAILEAVKIRMINIFQHRIFCDILIRPCVNKKAGGELIG